MHWFLSIVWEVWCEGEDSKVSLVHETITRQLKEIGKKSIKRSS